MQPGAIHVTCVLGPEEAIFEQVRIAQQRIMRGCGGERLEEALLFISFGSACGKPPVPLRCSILSRKTSHLKAANGSECTGFLVKLLK